MLLAPHSHPYLKEDHLLVGRLLGIEVIVIPQLQHLHRRIIIRIISITCSHQVKKFYLDLTLRIWLVEAQEILIQTQIIERSQQQALMFTETLSGLQLNRLVIYQQIMFS